MRVHFDLETGDPDDLMTLALLATHPRVDLVGVTVFPGGRDQVGLARQVLRRVNKTVPVGADPKDDGKERVGAFYRKWLGDITPEDPDCSASDVLEKSAKLGTVLVTGAPLTNVWRWRQASQTTFQSWTCQGGFAGDSVVPEHLRLLKFVGRETCPTFNLNGNPKASLGLLESQLMGPISLVSKNVCHGFWFDRERVEGLPRGVHAGLDLVLDGMQVYFKNHPDGKALHDILAAVLAIAPELGTWVQGNTYRERGEWGFRADPAGRQRIVIAADEPRVLEAMVR